MALRFTNSIAFRLTVLMLELTATILGAVIVLSYLYSGRIILQECEEDAVTLALSVARRIEQEFRAVAKVPEQVAGLLEISPPRDPAMLLKVIENMVVRNREVYGAAVAFEPYRFDNERRMFAPYFFKGSDGIRFVQLGSESYDYLKKDWYHVAIQARSPVWSQPYFDEGGGDTVMVTYSVPFFLMGGEGRRDKLGGVALSDLSLEWLRDMVASVKVGKGGHCFLISDNGTFVTHPRQELIMRESVFSLADERDDKQLREIGRRMLSETSGFVDLGAHLTGEDSFLAFARIPSIGWVLGTVFPKKDLFADLNRLHSMMLAVSVIGVGALLVASIFVAKSLSVPLRRMVAATDGVAHGNLDVDLSKIGRKDEIGVLAQAFTRMAGDLKNFIKALTETTAAKQRIESELDVARDIQKSMVPSTFPAFPGRTDFEIYAAMEPARQVGGDFYDFFLLDANRLCVAIGDVSGKGVPASLFMAVTRFMVRTMAREGLNPGDLLYRLNNELALDNKACMFVTVFLGVLDLESGELWYSSGGHEPSLIVSSNSRIDQLKAPGGPVVGLMEDVSFKVDQTILEPGDLLFAYTDGVTEAVAVNGDYFTRESLKDCLKETGDTTAKDTVEAVSQVLATFAKGAPQADDITMIALKFHGRKSETPE